MPIAGGGGHSICLGLPLGKTSYVRREFLSCRVQIPARTTRKKTAWIDRHPYLGVAQLEARVLWGHQAGGSNPLTQTMRNGEHRKTSGAEVGEREP